MVEIRRLLWDAWNVAHIARHDVTPDEVEAVCGGNPLVQQAKLGRLAIIGPTTVGRMLTVILDSAGVGAFYPVTARPSSKKERSLYRAEHEGVDQ